MLLAALDPQLKLFSSHICSWESTEALQWYFPLKRCLNPIWICFNSIEGDETECVELTALCSENRGYFGNCLKAP